MDKDFAAKVRKKRIRLTAIIVILAAAAVWIIYQTSFAKADYTESLSDEIKTAETLIADNKDNQGNGKGQYAPYTVLSFRKSVDEAKAVSESDDSAYTDRKEAYELLKDQVKAFKIADNSDVITKEEISKIASGGEDKTFAVDITDSMKIKYTVKADTVQNASDVNLLAGKTGPYNENIHGTLSAISQEGDLISFYHDGDFGCTLSVTEPLFYEDAAAGFVYKADGETGALTYVCEASVDTEEKTATFDITSGGDYIFLKEKLSEEQIEKTAETSSQSAAAGGNGSSAPASSGSQSGSASGGADNNAQPETITVTVSVENTVYTDKCYGTILGSVMVTMNKGDSAFAALEKACRDNGVALISTSSMYGTYIRSIGGLAEKDAGTMSGWQYYVNGSYPSYGVSEYKLSGGENIVFSYTK